MESIHSSPVSPIARWQEASKNCPADIVNKRWAVAGAVALSILLSGGALAGSCVMTAYGMRMDNIGMKLGGIFLIPAMSMTVLLLPVGVALGMSKYLDVKKYHEREVAQKVSSKLLTVNIWKLAKKLDLDTYEKYGIIGPEEKAKLLDFRTRYCVAQKDYESKYSAHKDELYGLKKEKLNFAREHAHLKPYYDAESKLAGIVRELESYQKNQLPDRLPFPMAQTNSKRGT